MAGRRQLIRLLLFEPRLKSVESMSERNTAPADSPATHVAAWFLAGLGEVLLTLGACVTPAWYWLVAEVAVFTAVGVLAQRRNRGTWHTSVVWPALVLILAAVWRSGILVEWARIPAYVAGPVVAVIAARVLHDVTKRLPTAFIAVLFAFLGVSVSRFMYLVGGKVATPLGQLAEDLQRPLSVLTPRPSSSKGPPLIVISIDTLRADYAQDTQTWKWFAERGATWTAAQSTASWTVPAMGSTWTGLLPADHGAGATNPGFASIKPAEEGVLTLAEQATAAGYDTAAFVVNPFVSTGLGFRRGFRTWLNPDEASEQPLALFGERWPLPGRDGVVAVEHALRWLDRAPDDGILLWVHLFDPHLPYTHLEEGHEALVVQHPKQVRRGKIKATPSLKRAVREAYGVEVEYSDNALQPLLQAIEARKFHERGAVVFFSDHGEELWEHDDFEHGHSHHKEVTEVPLAVVAGCVPAGPQTGVASLQDITPTLREVAGFEPIPNLPSGRSLCAPIPADRQAFAAGNLYGNPQTSVRTLTEKVIEVRKKKGPTRTDLYNLVDDPNENHPQTAPEDHPLRAAAGALQTAADSKSAAPVADELLCELGYVDCANQK